MNNQIEIITSVIRTIRGKKVILDADLARIYARINKGVESSGKAQPQTFS